MQTALFPRWRLNFAPSARSLHPGRGSAALRLLDRYAGIPLVLLTAGVRRKRPVPDRLSSIGVLNTAALGDTVLMSAVIADLRDAYPDAEITYLAGPSNYEAARLCCGAHRVLSLPLHHPLTAIHQIRRHRFDLLLDFGPWARLNALITRFSRAGLTVGFKTAGQYRHFGYDLAVEHSSTIHELENHRRLVRALGVATVHEPRLSAAGLGQAELSVPRRPFVIFHLWPGGSRAEQREWPIARWIRLAEELAAAGYAIVLTGSRAQTAGNDEIIRRVSPARRSAMTNAAGASLAATARLASLAALVVSVNTGVMHLAAALNSPLVALHGPTNHKRWGPVSATAVVIQSPLPGCGYLDLGFERSPRPLRCMEAIAYDVVTQACWQVLSDASSQSG